MLKQHHLEIMTSGRGLLEITGQIRELAEGSALRNGLVNLFLRHTSASLVISENADPSVLVDLQAHMAKLVEDGDPAFLHRSEGPDDMAAHLRSVLTQTSISLPITDGTLSLGVWQGIFLWEHRLQGRSRHLVVTFNGD